MGLAFADAGLEGTDFSLTSVTEVESTKDAALADVVELATPLTFSLATSSTTILEGATAVYTVTASKAVTVDTVVEFTVTPGNAAAADQGTNTTNLNDFAAGSFNPTSVTILAGSKTATFEVAAENDGKTELPESYTVSAVVGSTTLTKQVSLQDGATATTKALTSTVDNFSATSNTLIVNGVMVTDAITTGTTAQAGDTVIGGSSTDDTVNIQISGDGTNDTLSAFQTTGVENFFVSNFQTAGGPSTIDAGLMVGLKTVGLSSSSGTGDISFTNLKNIVDGTMKNGAGDLSVGYEATLVTGTADAQKLAVSNLTGGTFTSDKMETITVNSSLVKSTLTAVVSDALKTLNITGDKDLVITNAVDFVAGTDADTTIDATINASTFTGKLTVDASDANDIQVTGGTVDDTIKMGANLKKTDKIDGGTGADTLTMTAAALTDQFTGVTNVEKVAFDAATADVAMDVSKLSAGVTTVEVDMADGVDGGTAVTAVISKLAGQTVVLKHTVANTGIDTDADGANATITNATDSAADSVSVTLDAIGMVTTNKLGYDTINVAGFETVNLESKKSTTVTANEVLSLTDTLATKLVITGDADLTTTSTSAVLTSIDASALAAKLNLTVGANKASVVLGAKDDTIAYAANLNKDDTVDGGAGKDTLTATVTGLDATTGALKISNVETITLTTSGDNTLNLAGVTGATTVSVTANTQTITGLDLATKLMATGAATLKVTAANATGTDDTLTVEQKLDNDTTNVIEAKGGTIENLAIIMNDTGATANTGTFTLTSFEGKKVSVTQATTSATDTNVALGTLHKNVLTVDTSAIKGTQSASLANATAATTVNLGGTAAATVTGSGYVDTFNIGATTAAVHAITGGVGTDIVNITMAATTAADFSGIDVEKLNITLNPGDDVATAAGKNFHATVTDVTLAGGNSASTYTQDAGELIATTVKTFNASTFGGNIDIAIANDVFDDTLTVTGGALTTDSVTATYATAATYKPKTTGVETLKISAGNGAAAENIVVDLSNTTGVVSVEVNNIATVAADTVTVDKITTQKVVVAGSALTANVVEAKLADASGATDSVAIELKAASTITGTLNLKTTDIETVSVKAAVAATVDMSNISITEASKYAKLVVTGDKALTISALNADINDIDASGMSNGGSVVQTARSGTGAATYVGSAGNDTFIMANAGDALTGGEGTDTLTINYNAILGGLQVNLASTTDQVTSMNGSSNAAVQVGFENVDASGYAGSFGADITANANGSTIKGTSNADSITLGAGADIVSLAITKDDDSKKDTISSFTSTTDKLYVSAAVFDAATSATAFATLLTNDTDKVEGVEVITASEFESVANAAALTGGSIAAATNADQLIYLADTDTLYFNDDGATAGGLTAIATGISALVAGDIYIVA